MKNLADGFVIGALLKCVFSPLALIFSGQLDDIGSFMAGSIIIATVFYGEMYFRDV